MILNLFTILNDYITMLLVDWQITPSDILRNTFFKWIGTYFDSKGITTYSGIN